MNAAELEFHIRTTADFILADSTPLVLQRSLRISDGAGGQREGTPTLLPVQGVRLIPQQDKVVETQTTNGVTGHPDFVLLGLPGLDVAEHDTFSWDGWEWKVGQIHQTPAYEVKADVSRGAKI